MAASKYGAQNENNHAQSAPIDTSSLSREISWQIKLLNRVCVTKADLEKQVRDLIGDILGSMEGVLWVTEKKKKNRNNGIGLKPIFMVELTFESKQQHLARKYKYFKEHKEITIGINEALTTALEKSEWSMRNENKKKKDDDNNNQLPNLSTESVFEDQKQSQSQMSDPDALLQLRSGIDWLEKSLRLLKNSNTSDHA